MVWDVQSGTALSSVVAHSEVVNAISFFSVSDNLLVTAGRNHVRTWTFDASSRKLKFEPVAMGSLKRDFTTVCVSPDDAVCYCGTRSGDFVEVTLRESIYKRTGPAKGGAFAGGVSSASLIPGGDILIGTGEGVLVKVSLLSLRVISRSEPLGGGTITSIALTPDGTHFFAGTSRSNIFWVHTDTLKAELRSACHTEQINQLCFPYKCGGEVVASASRSEIRLWNTGSKQELLSVQVPNVDCLSIAFGRDGKSIVSGWSDGKIRAFTPQTGTLIFAIHEAHKEGVTALATCVDKIVSGGVRGEVRVWRIASPQFQQLEATMKEHRDRVSAIQVREDDLRAVSTSRDGSCIVWDLMKGVRLVCMIEQTKLNGVVYSADFAQVVTIGSDKKITYWDVFDAQPLRALDGAGSGALSVIARGWNERLIVAGEDGLVRVWDYDMGAILFECVGHSCPVTACACHEKMIVTGDAQGALYFWQM